MNTSRRFDAFGEEESPRDQCRRQKGDTYTHIQPETYTNQPQNNTHTIAKGIQKINKPK